MMEKICSILIVVLLIITSVVGCGGKDGDIKLTFKESMFHKDFQKAKDFESISKDIVTYLNAVVDAYNDSDKVNPETFELSSVGEKAQKSISNYMKVIPNRAMDEELYSSLLIQSKVLSVNTIIAGISLLNTAGSDDSSETFNELKNAINDAYEVYKSPIDFSKMPK